MAQTREEVFKDLVNIFHDQLGIEKDKIKESSDAVEDLGADDLDCVELVMSIVRTCSKYCCYSND